MVGGYVAAGFERVREAFAAGLEDEIGAAFAAVRDGEIIVDLWGGWTERTRTRPWGRDTIAPIHSATKGISAFILAMVADRKLLSYDDPVAALWPAFGARGKGDVTIAQAAAHQAGVPGFLQRIDPELWLDTKACADAIAALAPLWPPGTASGYHPMTWGYIVGELVQRAAERSVGTILREDVCAPHGIDFMIGTPESEHARCADMKKPSRPGDFGEINDAVRAAFFSRWAMPIRGTPRWRSIELPAANGHGTALAVARLYEIYASGGEIAGERYLSRDGVAAVKASRFRGDDLVLPYEIDWRSGIIGNSNRIYGPNVEAFGHSGSGGAVGFGDPKTRVSVGYVMNAQSHYIMGDPRSLRLIAALYDCL